MKTLSWILSFLLAVLLFFAFRQIPSPREGYNILSTHIGSRYQQRSEAETGIHSPVGAVLADYRGFDLLSCGFLFFLAGLGILFFFPQQPRFEPRLLGYGVLSLGLLLVLGLGFFCIWGGSDFLDYEALTLYFPSTRARLDGALILLGGVLLSLGGLGLVWIRWFLTPEGTSGR